MVHVRRAANTGPCSHSWCRDHRRREGPERFQPVRHSVRTGRHPLLRGHPSHVHRHADRLRAGYEGRASATSFVLERSAVDTDRDRDRSRLPDECHRVRDARDFLPRLSKRLFCLGGGVFMVNKALLASSAAFGTVRGSNTPRTVPNATDWPTYGHDPQHTFHGRTTITRGTVGTLQQAWSFPTGDAVTATPT